MMWEGTRPLAEHDPTAPWRWVRGGRRRTGPMVAALALASLVLASLASCDLQDELDNPAALSQKYVDLEAMVGYKPYSGDISLMGFHVGGEPRLAMVVGRDQERRLVIMNQDLKVLKSLDKTLLDGYTFDIGVQGSWTAMGTRQAGTYLGYTHVMGFQNPLGDILLVDENFGFIYRWIPGISGFSNGFSQFMRVEMAFGGKPNYHIVESAITAPSPTTYNWDGPALYPSPPTSPTSYPYFHDGKRIVSIPLDDIIPIAAFTYGASGPGTISLYFTAGQYTVPGTLALPLVINGWGSPISDAGLATSGDMVYEDIVVMNLQPDSRYNELGTSSSPPYVPPYEVGQIRGNDRGYLVPMGSGRDRYIRLDGSLGGILNLRYDKSSKDYYYRPVARTYLDREEFWFWYDENTGRLHRMAGWWL